MDAERKIAIPTFETRVSPRFDCAQGVLVVTIDEEGRPCQRQGLKASDWAPHERINRLLELGVDTVICGGIDQWSVESLRSAGVTIYGWVTGEVEEALTALLQGLFDCEAAMEGGGRRACRRFSGDRDMRSQAPGSAPGTGCGRGHGRGHRGQQTGGGPRRLRGRRELESES